MKLLLCITLLLLAAPLSESSCTFQKQDTSVDGMCHDLKDGTNHPFGESWNTNCWDCLCSHRGYDCCDRYSMPSGFSKDCMLTFDIRTCSFHAKRKDDPTADCAVGVLVGK